jgi:hypothetical protein
MTDGCGAAEPPVPPAPANSSPAKAPIVAPPGGSLAGYVPRAATPQGALASFVNLDPTGAHDVVASQRGADGKPIFRSAVVLHGETADVIGTDKLGAGSYAFFCSTHTQMRGNLEVVG